MQPGWPKAPVELNTLFVGSTLRKIQVQNGGSERRPKSMQEASLPSQKPWVFSCVLIFGSQFHEAHLWSTNWVPALTGLLCSSQWTSDEQLSCWRLYLRWRIYAYKVPTPNHFIWSHILRTKETLSSHCVQNPYRDSAHSKNKSWTPQNNPVFWNRETDLVTGPIT